MRLQEGEEEMPQRAYAAAREYLLATYARLYPERQVYVRSEGSIRYLTLSPRTQLAASCAAVALVGWALLATVSSYLSDSRLNSLDLKLIEVREAYEARISKMNEEYSRLEAEFIESEKRLDDVVAKLTASGNAPAAAVGQLEQALQSRNEALRRRVEELAAQRAEAQNKLQELQRASREIEVVLAEARLRESEQKKALDSVTSALSTTARERDDARNGAAILRNRVTELERQLADNLKHQERVMSQLESATRTSLGEMESVLRRTGLDVNKLIRQIEDSYGGRGGPFVPVSREKMANVIGPLEDDRVADLLAGLAKANILRIGLEKLPLDTPVRGAKLTSGFGIRRDPKTGGRAFHAGQDFGAPTGTSVVAPSEGVVAFAGWQSGYGKVIKIRHGLGFETVYGHLSDIKVSVGDRVRRGQRIGNVGSTGRSTGPHLHYEIRHNGDAINPARFIEAGRHVF